MPATANTHPSVAGPHGAAPPEPLPSSFRAAAGLVAAAVFAGAGLLVGSLVAPLVDGATTVAGLPGWLWWLSSTAAGLLPVGVTLVLIVIVLGVVGVAGGMASRRSAAPGVVAMVALGVLLLADIWVTSGALWLVIVPVLATVAAVGTFMILHRVGRRSSPPAGGAATASARLSRRRALLAGGALAVALGAAGLLTGAATAPGRTRPGGPVAGPGPEDLEPLVRGTVIDVREYGAAGDGTTDDTEAIGSALAAANEAAANEAAAAEPGATLFFPAGAYLYRSSQPLTPASGVVLSGVPGESRIDWEPADGQEFGLLVGIDADDVVIDGLELRRTGDHEAVILGLGAYQGFTLSRSSLVGGMDRFPDRYCHGIKLSDSAESTGLRITDSVVTTVQYGLFQANESTASTEDVLVERCEFRGNTNTDLEFNSPNGIIRRVVVQNCVFADNDSPGFGVGLATCEDVVVRSNVFENYAMEAVHVEDYTSRVTIEANQFTSCGLRMHSTVQIIQGATVVEVIGNVIDARANTVEVFGITAQPGGVGMTAGERPIVPPADVTVRDNLIDCGAAVTPIYFEGTTRGVITGNTITGDDLATPDAAFTLLDADVEVSGNRINGRMF